MSIPLKTILWIVCFYTVWNHLIPFHVYAWSLHQRSSLKVYARSSSESHDGLEALSAHQFFRHGSLFVSLLRLLGQGFHRLDGSYWLDQLHMCFVWWGLRLYMYLSMLWMHGWFVFTTPYCSFKLECLFRPIVTEAFIDEFTSSSSYVSSFIFVFTKSCIEEFSSFYFNLQNYHRFCWMIYLGFFSLANLLERSRDTVPLLF